MRSGLYMDDMIDMLAALGKAAREAKRAVTFSVDEMQGLKCDELKDLTAAIHCRSWRWVQAPRPT